LTDSVKNENHKDFIHSLKDHYMSTLVVGASGATGMKLVEQLINQGQKVKVIVRSADQLPESWKKNSQLTIIQASVLELSETEISEHLADCRAVASCLGHNLNLKGIYGQPRKLVTDATRLICNAIKANQPNKTIKFVLMNTTGNRNRDLNEVVSFGEKFIFGLIRLLLPPQLDNEKAADYLRTQIGQKNPFIEWAAVRPDGLIDEDKVSEYEIHASPIRSAIFNAGKTSRINVAHFMASLITDDELWNQWKGQMPVIYNKSFQNKK
jgi:hypothetical protein